MKIVEITEKDFEKEVLKEDKPVLIDFNADWCGPCRMLRPILDEVSEEVDNIKIVSINIDTKEAEMLYKLMYKILKNVEKED